MTAALTNSSTGASPLAGLMGRVKPLDPEELLAVAQQVQAEQEAAGQGQMAGAAQTGGAAGAGTEQAMLEQQLAAAQQQQAALMQQYQAQAQAQAGVATAATPTTQLAPTTSTEIAPTTSTTGGAGTAAAVAIPSSQVAPRTQFDYWTKHMAQFRGKYLPDGPTMRPNCGPASTTMALRMIGLDIPGFSGQNSEAVLDKARIIATGRNDTTRGTTDNELERLISASGGQWSESTDFNQIKDWIKQGIPVILSGNPAHGWNHRYSQDQVYPFNGSHWVTVSGYDPSSGYYIVNDPLSQIGPIYVSEKELASYTAQRWEGNASYGRLGIAVFR